MTQDTLPEPLEHSSRSFAVGLVSGVALPTCLCTSLMQSEPLEHFKAAVDHRARQTLYQYAVARLRAAGLSKSLWAIWDTLILAAAHVQHVTCI